MGDFHFMRLASEHGDKNGRKVCELFRKWMHRMHRFILVIILYQIPGSIVHVLAAGVLSGVLC